VDTIEVTGAAPLVDTTLTQLGAVVVNERFRQPASLPSAMLTNYCSFKPGVQSQLGVDGVYGVIALASSASTEAAAATTITR